MNEFLCHKFLNDHHLVLNNKQVMRTSAAVEGEVGISRRYDMKDDVGLNEYRTWLSRVDRLPPTRTRIQPQYNRHFHIYNKHSDDGKTRRISHSQPIRIISNSKIFDEKPFRRYKFNGQSIDINKYSQRKYFNNYDSLHYINNNLMMRTPTVRHRLKMKPSKRNHFHNNNKDSKWYPYKIYLHQKRRDRGSYSGQLSSERVGSDDTVSVTSGNMTSIPIPFYITTEAPPNEITIPTNNVTIQMNYNFWKVDSTTAQSMMAMIPSYGMPSYGAMSPSYYSAPIEKRPNYGISSPAYFSPMEMKPSYGEGFSYGGGSEHPNEIINDDQIHWHVPSDVSNGPPASQPVYDCTGLGGNSPDGSSKDNDGDSFLGGIFKPENYEMILMTILALAFAVHMYKCTQSNENPSMIMVLGGNGNANPGNGRKVDDAKKEHYLNNTMQQVMVYIAEFQDLISSLNEDRLFSRRDFNSSVVHRSCDDELHSKR